MIADKMKNMVANSSAIRAMFEEGTRLAGIYGRENVFDFSLGNPNVPAPQMVKDAIVELVNNTDVQLCFMVIRTVTVDIRSKRGNCKVSE